MVSVVIPVYNEEKTIEQTLKAVLSNGSTEIIVVDGGSSDRTIEVVSQCPVKLLHSKKNRASQLNEGARASNGDILLFLHADCILEKGSIEEIERCIKRGYKGGCLTHKIKSDRAIYRLIEASGNIRSRLFSIFYGDQALFVTRSIFDQIGGFKEVELFDDIIFSKELKKKGKLCMLNKKVFASPRRWEKQGIAKTTVINWVITVGFRMGILPTRLKKLYADIR